MPKPRKPTPRKHKCTCDCPMHGTLLRWFAVWFKWIPGRHDLRIHVKARSVDEALRLVWKRYLKKHPDIYARNMKILVEPDDDKSWQGCETFPSFP